MIGLAPRHSRPSLRARLTRQIIFAIAALLASFSVLTLAAIAAHLYHDAQRDTQTILGGLAAQHTDAVSDVIHAYNRASDPRIWLMRGVRIIAKSPNAAAIPRQAQYTGLLWNPATYQLSAPVGHTTFVIDWPLSSDVGLLQGLSTVVLIVTLAGVSAGAVMAGWTTRRTLEPVKSMTLGVQRMLTSGRILRIPLPTGRDEFHDLAELLNRLLSDLDERQRREEALLADATHHLRTPLAVIRGNLDLVTRADLLETSQWRESIAAMHRTTEEMSCLIDDLLAMEHAANLPHTLLTPISLQEMALEVMEDVHAVAHDRDNLTVEMRDHNLADARVMAYPEFARRAFWAVMENALKYCDPEAGRVWVTLVRDAERSFSGVAVSNNGPGIDPEDLPKVFGRFYRGATGRSIEGGTGLGLPLAQSLMRAQEGTVGLESDASRTRVTLWFRNAE